MYITCRDFNAAEKLLYLNIRRLIEKLLAPYRRKQSQKSKYFTTTLNPLLIYINVYLLQRTYNAFRPLSCSAD